MRRTKLKTPRPAFQFLDLVCLKDLGEQPVGQVVGIDERGVHVAWESSVVTIVEPEKLELAPPWVDWTAPIS